MPPNWLRGPLLTVAASAAATAADAVALAVAAPHDALIYVPQALGNGVLALAFAEIVRHLPENRAPAASLAWLRRPARVLVIGYSLDAFGWCWLAVSYRDGRSLILGGTALGALGAILTAVAFWSFARRLPLLTQQLPAVKPEAASPATAQPQQAPDERRSFVKAAAPLVRALSWVAALCVLFTAAGVLVFGNTSGRILGGFLLLAFLVLLRFLYTSRPKPTGSMFDRMQT